MGIREWYNSSSSGNHSIRLGQSGYETTRWVSFWRKMNVMEKELKMKMTMKKKKKKKNQKIMFSSSSMRVQCSYDQSEYSMNFDHGLGLEEPENLSRSFSARFADPSRIFPRYVDLLMD